MANFHLGHRRPTLPFLLASTSTHTKLIQMTGHEVFGLTRLVYAVWSCLKRLLGGKVLITHPQNNDALPPEWVEIEGTHKGSKELYWLLTRSGDKYWPQGPIRMQPGGFWKETINIGTDKGPRTIAVILVWVSQSMNAILEDIKDRNNRASYWGPIKMVPPKGHFVEMDGRTLQVQ